MEFDLIDSKLPLDHPIHSIHIDSQVFWQDKKELIYSQLISSQSTISAKPTQPSPSQSQLFSQIPESQKMTIHKQANEFRQSLLQDAPTTIRNYRSYSSSVDKNNKNYRRNDVLTNNNEFGFARAIPKICKTARQMTILLESFERNQYPTATMRDSLCNMTGLTKNQVRFWFQH